MKKDIHQMIVELDCLSVSDLDELKNRIDYILFTKEGRKSSKDSEYLDFYKLIVEEIGKRLNCKMGIQENYWHFKKKSPLFKKFKESYKTIEQFQENNCSIGSRKEDIIRFRLIAIKVILDFLEKAGIPISLTTFINNMHKVPGIVNNAFPMYAENGLLSKIL